MKFDTESAQNLAIQGLNFIAADGELLQRFLAITGIEASQVRQAAREPGFFAGVLQFLLNHEPTLLRFAEDAGIPPQAVGDALRRLPFGSETYERSI